MATGCHRGTTAAELEQKLGREIVEKEHIVVHDCDTSPLTELGVLPSGAKLVVNALVAQADLVVAEGFIGAPLFLPDSPVGARASCLGSAAE